MNSRTTKYYLFFLGLIILTTFKGCIDPFKPALDKSDAEQILVVEGMITNEPGSFVVKLSRSVPIDTMVNFVRESGAFVTISDDRNNTFTLYETEPGYYKCLDETVIAVTGRTYQLSIVDAFNKEYESSPVLMESKSELEKVFWEEATETVFIENEIVEENGLNIYVKADDPESKIKFYKWDISETWEVMMPNAITALDGMGMPYETTVKVPDYKKYCWVTRESQSILVKSVDNQTDSKVSDFLVQRIRPNEDKLFFRYSIEVRQYALSKEMYTFWNSLKEINQDAGSLYDKVPVSIFGNIRCCDNNEKVLGYFYAAEIAKKRIFIEKGEHKVVNINKYEGCLYVSDVTMYPFAEGYYARSEFCGDCRYYGSNVKPDFW
ncbi:MAG TPA: DUF4249 domain-containing protein [Draconibacterium sp.]|nr:DUF4249 domain-containing protein [Draconibacterium sp.]